MRGRELSATLRRYIEEAGKPLTVNEMAALLQKDHPDDGVTAQQVRNACFNMVRADVLVKHGKPQHVQRFGLGRCLKKSGREPTSDPVTLAKRRARRSKLERERMQANGRLSWAEWRAKLAEKRAMTEGERDREKAQQLAERHAAAEARWRERDAKRAAQEAEKAARKLEAERKAKRAAYDRKRRGVEEAARAAVKRAPAKPVRDRPASRRPLDQQPTTAPSFRQQIAAPEPLPSSFDWDGKIERIPAAWEKRA